MCFFSGVLQTDSATYLAALTQTLGSQPCALRRYLKYKLQINHLTSLWRVFGVLAWSGLCRVVCRCGPVVFDAPQMLIQCVNVSKNSVNSLDKWMSSATGYMLVWKVARTPLLRRDYQKDIVFELTYSYHTHLLCQLRSNCARRAQDKRLLKLLWSSAHKPLLPSSSHLLSDSAIL